MVNHNENISKQAPFLFTYLIRFIEHPARTQFAMAAKLLRKEIRSVIDSGSQDCVHLTSTLHVFHLYISRSFIPVRSPEGQVVAQQLHDQSAVFVRLFGQGVELRNRVVERRLGQVAGAVGGVEDLEVKHREVEGEAEANGVRWG